MDNQNFCAILRFLSGIKSLCEVAARHLFPSFVFRGSLKNAQMWMVLVGVNKISRPMPCVPSLVARLPEHSSESNSRYVDFSMSKKF